MDFVQSAARIVRDESFSLVGVLHEAASKRTREERERIPVGAIAVSAADGDCQDEEGALTARVANAVGGPAQRRQELLRSRA